MDKVVHFEIPYDEFDRAKEFYSNVFGWKVNTIPEMNYNMVHTVEVDEKQMPKETGAINGGMYKRDEQSCKTPVLVINVASVEEYIKKVEQAGGILFMPKRSVGEMGFYAQVKDTEGNIIGIWQTLKQNYPLENSDN